MRFAIRVRQVVRSVNVQAEQERITSALKAARSKADPVCQIVSGREAWRMYVAEMDRRLA